MTVEQGGVQAFFERADLAGNGRLRQMQRVAGMGEAACVGDCVKYSEFVPIHREITSPC